MGITVPEEKKQEREAVKGKWKMCFKLFLTFKGGH